MKPSVIRQRIEESIAKPGGTFWWPDDGCVADAWHYDVHCAWVGAWNREGRTTECIDFLRAWLTDENILQALEVQP
ncbi:MAG: hypothetical protein WC455_18905 [Dehalococcoidia bacterium]|jgi:hypothetical protein